MGILIKNGQVVSSKGVDLEDIFVQGEKIVKIGKSLIASDLKEEFPGEEIQIIDAKDKLIFPGFIDTHTHFDLDAGDFHTADDFYSGTKAAIAGGTTTILDFTTQEKGETLNQALDNWHKLADGKSSCDYGFHMSITDWNSDIKKEIKDMTNRGVNSYKLYMAYSNLKVNDGEIYEILKAVKDENGIVGVHCENGELIDSLIKELKSNNKNSVSLHPLSRPKEAEAEAIHRLLVIAGLVDTPVNIVHLSSKLSLEEVRCARENGQKVYVETCPQYLLLDDSVYGKDGFSAAKYVCSPPLRKEEDIEAIWKGLLNGEVQTIGTDHCSFNMSNQKTRGKDDFTKIPGGIPGTEERPVLIYHFGVTKGKITVSDMCGLLSEQPAKLFGMYPNKGTIKEGSDADIVIWNKNITRIISAKDMNSICDNTPYEDMKVTGLPEMVFLRGKLVAKERKIINEKLGKYVFRGERTDF
ncbi:MAG: dihydropyrimidinase [Lachnospiraceae bacterium]|nr:dihydropyrimidinase [Lachnospiraceae bacterium]